jgi:long-chain acyl-CoA synthetase
LAMSKLPCGFMQLYGMTEAAPLLTYCSADDHRRGAAGEPGYVERLKSAGCPAPGIETEVRREDGTVCEPGEPGEIYARGPNIMLGYWNRPEETAHALVDGWYRTGDVAYADSHGYLYIVDRAKDMIISGGENVYTTEVENALYANPAVLEAAAFGIPDEKWGEAVHAEVVLKPGHSITGDELISYARTLIAGYKVPRSINVRAEALPKSGAGKILKRDLRAPFWEGKERSVN